MQLGFDRLIEAMDALAPSLGMEVVAQTGKGVFTPQNMTARVQIAPDEFEALVERASVIVSHAGIGTILTAQRFAKPVVLFPRRFEFGEHRNDHQLATARQLDGRSGLFIAMTHSELGEKITEALAIGSAAATRSSTAQRLHAAIAGFIERGEI